MNIRRIRAEEGLRLRELRLRALADAPTAFGSTLVEEQARPKEDWDQLAAEEASSDARARFVAEQNTRWYGMAGVFVLQDQPEIAQLISMWVDPARRRSGIARALVDAVVRWAARTRCQAPSALGDRHQPSGDVVVCMRGLRGDGAGPAAPLESGGAASPHGSRVDL